MVFVFWGLAWFIEELPPFEREFDRKDALIDHSHKPNQYVPFNILHEIQDVSYCGVVS